MATLFDHLGSLECRPQGQFHTTAIVKRRIASDSGYLAHGRSDRVTSHGVTRYVLDNIPAGPRRNTCFISTRQRGRHLRRRRGVLSRPDVTALSVKLLLNHRQVSAASNRASSNALPPPAIEPIEHD
jgi:hypothetical protein